MVPSRVEEGGVGVGDDRLRGVIRALRGRGHPTLPVRGRPRRRSTWRRATHGQPACDSRCFTSPRPRTPPPGEPGASVPPSMPPPHTHTLLPESPVLDFFCLRDAGPTGRKVGGGDVEERGVGVDALYVVGGADSERPGAPAPSGFMHHLRGYLCVTPCRSPQGAGSQQPARAPGPGTGRAPGRNAERSSPREA